MNFSNFSSTFLIGEIEKLKSTFCTGPCTGPCLRIQIRFHQLYAYIRNLKTEVNLEVLFLLLFQLAGKVWRQECLKSVVATGPNILFFN